MTKVLYLKYLVQKFILRNADEIIFNTGWQKNIFSSHYGLELEESSSEGGGFRRGLFVIPNPVETIPKNIFENEKLSEEFDNAIKRKKFIFTSITRDIPYKNIRRLKKVFEALPECYLETQQGSLHGSANRCRHTDNHSGSRHPNRVSGRYPQRGRQLLRHSCLERWRYVLCDPWT
jgi:glycosyltransferase involved in cell wall biosynthesis